MFDKLFLQVLNMSFTASFVITLVLLVRLLLKKSPKVFSYALWLVVLFRLICPFSFESIFSILPTKTNPIPTNIGFMQTPQIDTGISIINNSINPILPMATPTASINPLQVWIFLGQIVWALGIIFLIIYSLVSLYNLSKKLKYANHLSDNIYISNSIKTPLVLGIFSPKIYLPSSLNHTEQEYILLHEKTHIKRLDHIAKILAFFALCVHWFNPFVWIAFFSFSKDMELSCDESVIKTLGNDIKKDYSTSLLNLSTGRSIISCTPLAFGEGNTKNRVKNVLLYKKPAFWVVIVSVIIAVAVGIALMTNPKTTPDGFSGVNAIILEIDSHTPSITVEGIDENSVIGDRCIVTWEENALITLDENYNPVPLSLENFSVGDYVVLFVGPIQESYPTKTTATTIQLQPKDSIQSTDFIRMVMIDGALYIDTGEAGPMGDSGAVGGTIKSTVSGDKKPTENQQSNFGYVGSMYAGSGDFIQVNIDDKWIVFKKETSLNYEQAIVNALLSSSSDYISAECFAEGHIILGTEESNHTTKIYALTSVGYYGFINDNLVKISGTGTTPTVITIQNNDDVTIEYPLDGGLYAQSISKMFPEKYHSRVLSINESDSKDLAQQEHAYAKNYLSSINRKGEIGDYGDFEYTYLTDLGVSIDVSNGLEDFYKSHINYPYFVGTTEVLENNVRMVYELGYNENQNEIIFTKYVYDTKEVIQQFIIDSLTGAKIS